MLCDITFVIRIPCICIVANAILLPLQKTCDIDYCASLVHGIGDLLNYCPTLRYTALYDQNIKLPRKYLTAVTWINVLAQITKGLTCLHNKYKLIHNDIKMDNICLSLTITSQIKVVIIDFGKASNADQGKLYKLTDHEKEQYKACHPHIAPDLHNGLCRQSVMSDVYALGRIINTVNGVSYLQNKDMKEFSETCMHYNEKSRPEMSTVENYFDHECTVAQDYN